MTLMSVDTAKVVLVALLFTIIFNEYYFINGFGLDALHPRHVNEYNKKISMVSVEVRGREFRNLRPLPCSGSYKLQDGDAVTSFYLAPVKMTVQERSDGKMITRGVVPVPVASDLESAIISAMNSSLKDRKNIFKSWSGQLITDRNNGLYDYLSQVFLWADKPYARKEIYESLRLKSSCESPYHGICLALEKFAGLKIRGLLVELADSPSEYSATLGAAILVCKEEFADNWKLTATQPNAIKAVRGSDEAQLVKCTMDELVGIALATNLPVLMKTTLYESVSIDGLMKKDLDSEKVSLTVPYFGSRREEVAWRNEQERQTILEEKSRRSAKPVPAISDIKDATSFLLLKTSEKRAILRQSGLVELPRPREGPRAVDALMIPLLDEEVAYEVLRRLAETKGNFKMAAEMNDFESRKPLLAKQINEARKNGNIELAEELCGELNSLSTLKFDPTNPDTARGQEWDVEEWYWEQRKRVYGIIAA